MNDRDWGADPGVRSTRDVFRRMEAGQRELLARAGVAPHDERLRRWRTQALRVFEDTLRTGRPRSAEEAAAAYVEGFARLLAAAGVTVPAKGAP